MVDGIDVVHVVMGADDIAHHGGADADQAIVRLTAKGQGGHAQERIGNVEHVGPDGAAGPGEKLDLLATDPDIFAGTRAGITINPFPAQGVVQAGGAWSGQGFQGGNTILGVAGSGQGINQPAQGVGNGVGAPFNIAAGRDDAPDNVSDFGAFVHAVNRRDRGNLVGNQGRCHPGGGGTLTVRHQIDLAVAQAVDVIGQLLATLF